MIKILHDRVIFDGHAEDKATCETTTLLANALAKSEDFKQVEYRSGYAEFEKVGKAGELKFATPAVGYTYIYDKDGTLVYEATCGGGDDDCTVTLQKNIVTVVYSNYKTSTVVIKDVTTNTKNISIASDSSAYTTVITLPYAPIKITFASGGGATPVTVLQGETKEATNANGAVFTGAGIDLRYFEEATPTISFKHFYKNDTLIGTGAYKFRRYSVEKPASGYTISWTGGED